MNDEDVNCFANEELKIANFLICNASFNKLKCAKTGTFLFASLSPRDVLWASAAPQAIVL